MATAVDIVGIGSHLIEYPPIDPKRFEDSFDKYIEIAKKVVAVFAPRYRPGLSEEILRSEDAISNIATAIMIADWRWNPEYKSADGTVRT